VATDADLGPAEELEFPTMRPFGHYVGRPRLENRDYCIVSEARGLLGYFADPNLAQPFLRMLMLNADRGHGRHDFRLWRWDETAPGWTVHQRSLVLRETEVPA
jgi:hypothetical protein